MPDDPSSLSPAAILRRIANSIDPEDDLLRVDLAAVTSKHDDAHHGTPPPRPSRGEEPPDTEMVQWLHPKLLFGAAREVVVSGLFARFADKRENQAAYEAPWFDATGFEEPLWLDYASDTGDGWEPTYAIAYLLGRAELELGGERLPRGQILVLGGDQVYPSAEWDAYQEKFVAPFTASLPFLPQTQRPLLFALPGNHDWYDGLTSFMRQFCSQRSIGAWQTVQARSYFAIKLAKGRWLWAVDTQFDTYVDYPQLSYFWAMAEKLAEGDEVVLVTAKPSWVGKGKDPTWNGPEQPDRADVPQSWQTLAFVEEKLIAGKGATLKLTLTGDLHHYSRYEGTGEQADRHKVTAGGAGAFLSATHTLQEEIHLVDHKHLTDKPEGERPRWTREAVYPSAERSQQIAEELVSKRIVSQTKSFAGLTAVVYLLFGALAWLAQVVWWVGYPLLALLTVGLWFGLAAFSDIHDGDAERRKWRKRGYGLVHAAFHLIPLAIVVAAVLIGAEGLAWELVVVPAAALFGYLWGPSAFGRYLLWADGRSHGHATEIFAAQSRTTGRNYKHFLRIRIDAEGDVTVYPIGVEAPPDRDGWEPNPDGEPSDPWFELKPSGRLIEELIEPPIQVSKGRAEE